jgi:hypothetical protein
MDIYYITLCLLYRQSISRLRQTHKLTMETIKYESVMFFNVLFLPTQAYKKRENNLNIVNVLMPKNGLTKCTGAI